MTESDSAYEIDMAWASQLRQQTWSITLSPELWQSLILPQPLNWHRTTFDDTQANQMPNDLIGVYAFVLEPNIANLSLAYLLYVGMTTDSFRARFRKYKRHQQEERTNRQLVKLMLTTWPDRLAFYYAAIEDRDAVQPTEDALIAAFKPPVCRKYPARVSAPFNILDRP